MKKIHIYESDKIEFRTMSAFGFDDMDCEVTDEELHFINSHEAMQEKYQTLLRKIWERSK